MLREKLRKHEQQLKEYFGGRRERMSIMAGLELALSGEVPSPHLSARIKTRKSRTQIAEVAVPGGVVSGPKQILKAASDYFRSLFGEDKRNAISDWVPAAGKKLMYSDIEMLQEEWTEKEVRTALHEMASNKTPGKDGLPKEVFELHWDKLGKHVMELVREFSQSSSLPTSVKDAVTILLHKKGAKEQLENYRPITLLNISYKLLARVLASRIKKVLHRVISREQFGFIPGRRISDAMVMKRKLGISLTSCVGQKLSYVGYADDTTLLLQGKQQIGRAEEELEKFKNISGLEMNVDKSVVMPLGANLGKKSWRSDGFRWAEKDEAERLLGVWITPSGSCQPTWDKALQKMVAKMSLWQPQYLPIKARTAVMDGYILPIAWSQAQVYPPPAQTWGVITKMTHNFISDAYLSDGSEDSVDAHGNKSAEESIDAASGSPTTGAGDFRGTCEAT
ncbi:unnamed protein product [Closterium sp. NIES-65]|nr:unnamed protein product [Closterium sp. NIES-65]